MAKSVGPSGLKSCGRIRFHALTDVALECRALRALDRLFQNVLFAIDESSPDSFWTSFNTAHAVVPASAFFPAAAPIFVEESFACMNSSR